MCCWALLDSPTPVLACDSLVTADDAVIVPLKYDRDVLDSRSVAVLIVFAGNAWSGMPGIPGRDRERLPWSTPVLLFNYPAAGALPGWRFTA